MSLSSVTVFQHAAGRKIILMKHDATWPGAVGILSANKCLVSCRVAMWVYAGVTFLKSISTTGHLVVSGLVFWIFRAVAQSDNPFPSWGFPDFQSQFRHQAT